MSVQDRVHELLEPVVATLDVELIDVEFNGGILRITVDQDEGISTESLTSVNRLIAPILDQHDPIPGRYTLEVSSPGLERRLKRVGHYRRAVGEQIDIKLQTSTEPRRMKARLLGVDGSDEAADGVLSLEVFEVDGVGLAETEQRELTLAEVANARTIFDWGPGPKPGQPGSKKPNKQQNKKQNKQKASAGGGGPQTKTKPKSQAKAKSQAKNKSSKKKSSNSPLNREVRDEQ